MRCFVHQDIEAVGVCRCCAKGTCAACALPVTNGIACSEACRPVAEEIAQLQLVSLRNQGLHRAQRLVQPVVSLLMLAYGVWTVYAYPSWPIGWIFAAGGLAIVVSQLVSSRRRRFI
jgi:hypothetical protein